MNPTDHETVEQICAILRSHEQTVAQYHAEVASRSQQELAYDAFIVRHLERGRPFEAILRRANHAFPSIALNPVPGSLRELEEHYQFHARMRRADADRLETLELDEKIRTIEENIEAVLHHTLCLEHVPYDQIVPIPEQQVSTATAV